MTTRLDFDVAYELAHRAFEELRTKLDRLKLVGSLRRKCRTIGDIEFLARPHLERDLSGELADPVLDDVRRVLCDIGTWKKGADRQMVITDLYGRKGVQLELYLVHPPAAWGSMVAIRTGPADLNRIVMTRLRDRKIRHIDGHARRIGTEHVIPTDTEEQFFELAGLDCLAPRARAQQANSLRAAQQAKRR